LTATSRQARTARRSLGEVTQRTHATSTAWYRARRALVRTISLRSLTTFSCSAVVKKVAIGTTSTPPRASTRATATALSAHAPYAWTTCGPGRPRRNPATARTTHGRWSVETIERTGRTGVVTRCMTPKSVRTTPVSDPSANVWGS
jgi:hypothetical protein